VGSFAAVEQVLEETRALAHRLRIAWDQVHGAADVSDSRRLVLQMLDRRGPRTVPQLARARPVSRQHVQSVVNTLIEDGLVEYLPNPVHQRSHLVTLTPAGKMLVDQERLKETLLVEGLRIEVADDDLRAAASVLTKLRAAFESERWRQLVAGR
jgi:DNA-binding MarR family transcriptional regulator